MAKINIAEKLSLPTEGDIWDALSALIHDEVGGGGYAAVHREAAKLAQASSWAELREWAQNTSSDACAAMGHTTALVALRRAGVLA